MPHHVTNWCSSNLEKCDRRIEREGVIIMKRSIARWMIGLCIMALLLVLGSIVWKAQSAANPRVEEAQRIITATGVKGGLIVHLGCGDGRLTVALHVNDSYIVHGLDRDPKNVEKARTYIHSLGLYGKVSVDTLRGEQLPYIDNFVNLLVVEDMNGISMNEVMRVLCPKGVAYIRQGSKWLKRIKPWPKEIDEWT
ncbi:MAG TPA: methyltransferase domain-containing protein, partial [Armatimonadetes bacterium]|nr:methyltransferase domain-containing protein [Armatimonadota bacterium]